MGDLTCVCRAMAGHRGIKHPTRHAEAVTMERIWRKNYPPGVPFEADVDAYSSISIADLFARSVMKFGAQTASVHMGTSINYSDLERLSDDFSVYLRSVLRLPTGAPALR
jgi:hypothetical protein